MPTDWTRRRLWLAYLACGLLVSGAGLALPDLAYSAVAILERVLERSPEQLIGIADDALYKARHEGRNRVVATPSPAAQPGERSSNPIGSAPPS